VFFFSPGSFRTAPFPFRKGELRLLDEGWVASRFSFRCFAAGTALEFPPPSDFFPFSNTVASGKIYS